jgi:phasin family protein
MTTINTTAEQFGDFSKNAVDAAMQFAHASISSAERMMALNLEATKVGLDQTSKTAKSFAGVKDVQELNTVSTKTAETGLEFFTGYSKNLYEITTAAQAKFSALIEERVAGFQKSVADSLDKAAKSAPAGSDVAIAAMKQGLATSTAAMDSISKASKQASSYAENAFKTATESATKATASSKRK